MNITRPLCRLLLFAVLLLMSPTLCAQDDFELWGNVDLVKSLSDRWVVGLETEIYTRTKATEMDCLYFSPNVQCKIVPHLKAIVGFTAIAMNNRAAESLRADGTLEWRRKAYWSPRIRVYASLTGDVTLGRFNIALRERYQVVYSCRSVGTRDYYDSDGRYDHSEDDVAAAKASHVLRSRPMIEYDIRNFPLTPFVSVEFTNNFKRFHLDKIRYTVGANWTISKAHIVTFGYIYEDRRGGDPNAHVAFFGYKFKF